VRRPLVVVRPGLVVRPEHERPARDQDLAAGRPAGAGLGLVERVGQVAQLQRLKHGLDVLVLVLHEHPVDERTLEQPLAAVEVDAVEELE
jgi:hypothetical protein